MSAFAMLHAGLEPYPGYRLVRPIGRGGFAEVWEAECDAGARVALKFIPADSQAVAAQEIRSIQALRRLDHVHLIGIERVWCHECFIVIAMELADGSLLDVLDFYQAEQGTPLPPDLALDYLSQAAVAIDYLNCRQHTVEGQRVGFQHCDIKPSNLLLCGDTVKLCDFGLAAPTCALLRTHRRAGTPEFTAPEVFQRRLSNWTDQYALAVTYCQLRGGRLPFHDTPRRFQGCYVRPAPDLSMLPAEERPILARAMAVVPQDRWPSCMDLMAQLASLAEKEPEIIPMPDNVVENPVFVEDDMQL